MSTPICPDPETAFDMDFCPKNYSDFDGPVAAVLNGINGQMRREMARSMLTAEGLEKEAFDALLGPIDRAILKRKADEDRVLSMNQNLGPQWLGGEYLPDLRAGEMEIARIVLDSVLLDVFSIRARWSGGRYHYRILDEYETAIRHRRKTSKRTLTLRQLIELIQSAEGVETTERGYGLMELWWERQWECGEPPEKCTAFAWDESEIYPELPRFYQLRARAWEAER